MKTGIIVYVLGSQGYEENFDEKQAIQGLNLKVDNVEFVFSGEKYFDINDAWLNLIRKGMNRVVCRYGEITDQSKITLKDHELQLCAY